YVFEVVSPETRIVTPYPNYKAYLLTVKNNENGFDFVNCLDSIITNKVLDQLNHPKRFHFKTVDEIVQACKDLPTLDEGYVCHQELSPGEIYRVKVKNPAYVAIFHLRENGCVSKRRITDIVMMNEESEYLKYFPEDMQFFKPFIDARN